MSDHLEIERKFDVDPAFALPDLSALPGIAAVSGPDVHHLAATYYDTPDLRLAGRKITLRRRTGGTDAGWHLKLPAGQPGARHEFSEPLSDELPARFAVLIADVTAGAAVAPIATLDTKRAVLTLLTSSGSAAAEIADDLVTAQRTGTGRPPMSWREVEVEQLSSSSGSSPGDVLEATARLLLAAGARPSGSGSKLGRLLGS